MLLLPTDLCSYPQLMIKKLIENKKDADSIRIPQLKQILNILCLIFFLPFIKRNICSIIILLQYQVMEHRNLPLTKALHNNNNNNYNIPQDSIALSSTKTRFFQTMSGSEISKKRPHKLSEVHLDPHLLNTNRDRLNQFYILGVIV